MRSGILYHSPWEQCLEGWRRWNFLFLLCVWELHMMVRVWWCSDWELGETTNAFDLKTYHQTIYLSGCRRKEETWLFRTLPFFRFVWCSCSNLSIICCHFAITKWQPNCMFQLSWPVHVQRVSEYFYYLLFFVAWFVIILFV